MKDLEESDSRSRSVSPVRCFRQFIDIQGFLCGASSQWYSRRVEWLSARQGRLGGGVEDNPMPGIQNLFYDQAGLLLRAEIIDGAIADATKYGICLPADLKQSRMLLAERILRGVEAGETDMGRLKELVLMPQ